MFRKILARIPSKRGTPAPPPNDVVESHAITQYSAADWIYWRSCLIIIVKNSIQFFVVFLSSIQ